MTHSYDRTLLATLGFADPDRRTSDHDLACEYLRTSPGVMERLVRTCVPPDVKGLKWESRREVPISKGEGKYKTTVGFIDVLVHVEFVDPIEDEMKYLNLIVEVKATPSSVGDLHRQLSLYREYPVLNPRCWHRAYNNCVAATLFPLSEQDRNQLESDGIKCIRIGSSNFEEWKRALPDIPKTPEVEV